PGAGFSTGHACLCRGIRLARRGLALSVGTAAHAQACVGGLLHRRAATAAHLQAGAEHRAPGRALLDRSTWAPARVLSCAVSGLARGRLGTCPPRPNGRLLTRTVSNGDDATL